MDSSRSNSSKYVWDNWMEEEDFNCKILEETSNIENEKVEKYECKPRRIWDEWDDSVLSSEDLNTHSAVTYFTNYKNSNISDDSEVASTSGGSGNLREATSEINEKVIKMKVQLKDAVSHARHLHTELVRLQAVKISRQEKSDKKLEEKVKIIEDEYKEKILNQKDFLEQINSDILQLDGKYKKLQSKLETLKTERITLEETTRMNANRKLSRAK